MKVFITDLKARIKNDFSDIVSKLSKEDTNRLAHITNPSRRLQFLVGRAMIFDYFGSYFQITPNGKPVSKKKDRYLSLAHSHQYVILAVCNQPVGIDIEKISDKRNFEGIAKRLKFKENLSLEDFYQAFTAYEANFKLGSEIKAPYHHFFKWNDFMVCVALKTEEKVEIIETSI